MNDLHEKKENDIDGSETQLRYKKLSANLLLLYQAYLQKETTLEPEIKASLWRMVQFQEDFPMKIRMMQLDYLSFETDNFDGKWDKIKDSLFPIKDAQLLDSLSAERKKQIQEYKAVVLELLAPKV